MRLFSRLVNIQSIITVETSCISLLRLNRNLAKKVTHRNKFSFESLKDIRKYTDHY